MTATSIVLGQSRVVGFFVICCVSVAIALVRNLISGTRLGFGLVVAQSTFVLFAGAASWYLYQCKKAGWYLSVLAVFDWFLGLTRMEISWNVFGNLATVGMFVVLIWLFLPGVKAHFDLNF